MCGVLMDVVLLVERLDVLVDMSAVVIVSEMVCSISCSRPSSSSACMSFASASTAFKLIVRVREERLVNVVCDAVGWLGDAFELSDDGFGFSCVGWVGGVRVVGWLAFVELLCRAVRNSGAC